MTPFGKWKPIETRKPHPQWERVKSDRIVLPHNGIGEVNSDINHSWKYQREERDHWQSPNEMMASGAGDCEDFAILKRAFIGRGEIIIGYDNILGGNHAVLYVDGVVLDCTHDGLLRPEEMPHFKPIMGMNDKRYWIFGKADD